MKRFILNEAIVAVCIITAVQLHEEGASKWWSIGVAIALSIIGLAIIRKVGANSRYEAEEQVIDK